MSSRAVAVTLLVYLCLPASGAAQVPIVQATTPAPPPAAGTEFQVGIEERFRYEAWDDIVDHSKATADERTQWRFRTRMWASAQLGRRVAFRVGLTNESKGQGVPRVPLTLDETIFESLWMDVRPHRRLSVRVGRQNFGRGDGLVVRDGTPGDGSRTEYVNGVDATFVVAPKATLEIVALSDPSRDTYLPVIHDHHRLLVEWGERLAGLYYTDTRRRGLDVQAYYFFKREEDDVRSPSHRQYQPDRDVNTIGGRVSRTGGATWAISAEAAGQFGSEVPDTAIRAWAASLSAQRRLAARWAPAVRGAFTALSGDSPATKNGEGWDPVLARWPMWSEAVINALTPEVGTAYWTNMGLWRAEFTMTPSPRTGVRATYYHLSAFHPFPGPQALFAAGTNRGDMLQARFDFTLPPTLRGHVLYERLFPGSFYRGQAPGYFFRVECTAAFQHRWAR
jgi:hypothetical protein